MQHIVDDKLDWGDHQVHNEHVMIHLMRQEFEVYKRFHDHRIAQLLLNNKEKRYNLKFSLF